MKQTKYTCDIEGCNNEIKDKKNTEKRLPAIFITNQTDGASREPYLDNVKLDMCPDCYLKIDDCYRYIKWVIGLNHEKPWGAITNEQVEREVLAVKKMLEKNNG